jgi:hypothetical protein
MSHRALVVSREQASALRSAADYLHRLRKLELAHALGDTDHVEAMFSGIDPVDVEMTANALHALTLVWDHMPDEQFRGGPERSPLDARESAPVIPLDPYSRKAPCA